MQPASRPSIDGLVRQDESDPAPGDYPPERQRPARSRVNGRAAWMFDCVSGAARTFRAHCKRPARVASVGPPRGTIAPAGSPPGYD